MLIFCILLFGILLTFPHFATIVPVSALASLNLFNLSYHFYYFKIKFELLIRQLDNSSASDLGPAIPAYRAGSLDFTPGEIMTPLLTTFF
jgi:hypothetical protein